jgi:hypothetical protein
MALAARVVAEPLVPSAFSAVRLRLSKREQLAAVFAACDIAAGSHEPVHLQIGHSYEALETPSALDAGRIDVRRLRASRETQRRTTQLPYRVTYADRSFLKCKREIRFRRGIIRIVILFSKVLVCDKCSVGQEAGDRTSFRAYHPR